MMDNAGRLAHNYVCCVSASRQMSKDEKGRLYIRVRDELRRMERRGVEMTAAGDTCKGRAEFGLYGLHQVPGSACSSER